MLDNETYKKDKKLASDIRNINYPNALVDLYEHLEKIYEKEIEDKKK